MTVPAWKRLVADIEAGKVAHLLCKDLNRIGRNYLQTGFYTEVILKLLFHKDSTRQLMEKVFAGNGTEKEGAE